MIFGGDGNDIFDMSERSYNDFTITDNNYLHINHTIDGTNDLLQDVEYIQFADGIYDVFEQSFVVGVDLLG